jgi:hypothetical protein
LSFPTGPEPRLPAGFGQSARSFGPVLFLAKALKPRPGYLQKG